MCRTVHTEATDTMLSLSDILIVRHTIPHYPETKPAFPAFVQCYHHASDREMMRGKPCTFYHASPRIDAWAHEWVTHPPKRADLVPKTASLCPYPLMRGISKALTIIGAEYSHKLGVLFSPSCTLFIFFLSSFLVEMTKQIVFHPSSILAKSPGRWIGIMASLRAFYVCHT